MFVSTQDPTLSDNDLQELGVRIRIHRKKILELIQRCKSDGGIPIDVYMSWMQEDFDHSQPSKEVPSFHSPPLSFAPDSSLLLPHLQDDEVVDNKVFSPLVVCAKMESNECWPDHHQHQLQLKQHQQPHHRRSPAMTFGTPLSSAVAAATAQSKISDSFPPPPLVSSSISMSMSVFDNETMTHKHEVRATVGERQDEGDDEEDVDIREGSGEEDSSAEFACVFDEEIYDVEDDVLFK